MATTTLTNGHVNGQMNGLTAVPVAVTKRFSDIPSAIDIPVSGEAEEAVELNLEELLDDPTELCTLLDNENASKTLWLTVSLAYAKQHMVDLAIEICNRGLQTLSRGLPKEKIGLLSLQCWLYIWKSREAPRMAPEGELVSEAKTKDFYLQAATGALNEASRANPSFPPLFLARGVLSLLRASFQASAASTAPGGMEQSERTETLRQALKCFEDASRVSAGRNMMAAFGKAKTLFSLRRYEEAFSVYQDILTKMPDLHDPDPRIGLGCCLWQLNHVPEAKEAWQRALEINPDSPIANILIGLYYLYDAQKHSVDGVDFLERFKRAMTIFGQRAFDTESKSPLAHTTLANYFYSHQVWDIVEKMCRRAIELTDTNTVASDAWYLLAKKEHYLEAPNWSRVEDYYNRADSARGGGENGYLPAKFGSIQANIMEGKIDDAKFRLEKLVQRHNSIEARVVLGNLYAQEIFANQAAGLKEDKSQELKKALHHLEQVRLSWKDSKKGFEPDINVLLILSRLYEAEQPEKSLACLVQARQLAIENLGELAVVPDAENEQERKQKQSALLPPQLLNNLGCFQFQLEKFSDAAESFQLALGSSTSDEGSENSVETDQLITTISYNLARSYEASHMLDEARALYDQILARHSDYIDAQTRLAYIELRQNPSSEGPKAIGTLYEVDSQDMEIRCMYGWYLNKAKRRVQNIAEDQEQRHYKHTLQQFDKHDYYSLTGMGNLYLTLAREMRRETEQEKEKRRKTYERAVEFFGKALQLDPKNAYAAQGVAIAMAEDKKDFNGAIQIFLKVKETVKESCVLINLGHAYGEMKQFQRAIEHYEAAVAKDRAHDPQILASLGRIWLLKGKQEKSIQAMKTSLDYSRQALALAPSEVYFQFNIAFVQIQLASLVQGLSETKRTLADVEFAITGLDEAIETFIEISKAPRPPYPRNDIEQRANMGRNTIRKQLDRALQSQREYEDANAAKVAEVKRVREAELARREEERRKTEAEEAERRRRLQEERERMLASARELAEKRDEAERVREEAEYTEDSDGNRVKRRGGRRGAGTSKRKKKHLDEDDGIVSDSNLSDAPAPKKRREKRSEANTDEEGTKSRKKRKLARRGESTKTSKFKSAELVVDSDEDDEVLPASSADGARNKRDAFDLSDEDEDSAANVGATQAAPASDGDVDMEDAAELTQRTQFADDDDDDEDDEDAIIAPRKKAARARIEEDEDEEEEEVEEERKGNAFADGGPEPMVDESVAAAGNKDGGEQEIRVTGDAESNLPNQ